MDNWLIVQYRWPLISKGVTQEGRFSVPNGHGASLILGEVGAGKSAPNAIAEERGELRGDPRRLS
jgi:hypothetical protein